MNPKSLIAVIIVGIALTPLFIIPGSGAPIRNDHDLVAIFGLKACNSHPANSTPDPAAEWLFLTPGSMERWDYYAVGTAWDDSDDGRLDKTVLNATMDLTERIPEYYDNGHFFTPQWFHTFVRVVNKTALLQWDIWFTGLQDMCAIKMYSFDPFAGSGADISVKNYPVIGYAAGSLDTEIITGEEPIIWSLVKNSGGEALAHSGINRLVLQVASIRRNVLSVDVDWSNMVYRADMLTSENIIELQGTFGRNASAPYTAGEPHRLVGESSLASGDHYGLNATGEVRYYSAGTDPDTAYQDFATYRVPVRQAMWRAEAGSGLAAFPVQRKRGWSYKIMNTVEIPENAALPRCPGEGGNGDFFAFPIDLASNPAIAILAVLGAGIGGVGLVQLLIKRRTPK